MLNVPSRSNPPAAFYIACASDQNPPDILRNVCPPAVLAKLKFTDCRGLRLRQSGSQRPPRNTTAILVTTSADTRDLRLSVAHPLIRRSLPEPLTVVRIRLTPAEDARWLSKLARVARSFDGVEPCDQLLVKVAASGQRPATDAVEDLTAKSQTGVELTGSVLLLQTPELTVLYCTVFLPITDCQCSHPALRHVESARQRLAVRG
jgi:hypothetical protein